MRRANGRGGMTIAGVVMVAAGLLAGLGSDRAGAAGGQTVKISHARFVPAEVEIPVGGTVNWANEDEDGHSITADDGSFDSHPDCREDAQDRCLAPEASWSHTFDKAGRYPYHSRTEGQKGVVVVRG